MAAYRSAIEQAMKKYYATLGEKDRRRYAAVEAMKLGSEGVKYIAQLLDRGETGFTYQRHRFVLIIASAGSSLAAPSAVVGRQ